MGARLRATNCELYYARATVRQLQLDCRHYQESLQLYSGWLGSMYDDVYAEIAGVIYRAGAQADGVELERMRWAVAVWRARAALRSLEKSRQQVAYITRAYAVESHRRRRLQCQRCNSVVAAYVMRPCWHFLCFACGRKRKRHVGVTM